MFSAQSSGLKPVSKGKTHEPVRMWVVLKIMGLFLYIDYSATPNIQGYQKWDPNFGNYPKP